MNRRIRLFADVTVLRFGGLAEFGIFNIALFEVGRRENVWRGKEGLAPQFPDAGLRQRHFFALSFRRLVMTAHGLDQPAACRIVGFEDLPCSAKQTALIFLGYIG